MNRSHEWFLNRFKERRPDMFEEYKFIEEYKSSREKIKARHTCCGEEVYVIPNSLISRGSGCNKCSRNNSSLTQTKSHEEYEKELPDNITTLEQYTGAHKQIKVHCSICDSTYDIRARDLAKRGCSHCEGGRYHRTIEDIILEVDRETNGTYTVMSDTYNNAHTHLMIKHIECDNIYPVTIANFRKGRRCPHCQESVGETLVANLLNELGVKFERQTTFDNLINIRKLSYDFFLPDYNLLIEYQGEQHYKPIKLFGGKAQFEIQCKLDDIKREYAKENGYHLLEIPYTANKKESVKTYLNTHI